MSDDLQNILAGVNIPIIVLGGDRRIRHATQSAERLLHVMPADSGRPISDIRMGLAIGDLNALISAVLGEGRALEREVRAEDGRWYSLHLRPYWIKSMACCWRWWTSTHSRRTRTPRAGKNALCRLSWTRPAGQSVGHRV